MQTGPYRGLEKKTIRVEKQQHSVILERLSRIQAVLLPDGALQERVYSPLAPLAGNEERLADMLLDTAMPKRCSIPAITTSSIVSLFPIT